MTRNRRAPPRRSATPSTLSQTEAKTLLGARVTTAPRQSSSAIRGRA